MRLKSRASFAYLTESQVIVYSWCISAGQPPYLGLPAYVGLGLNREPEIHLRHEQGHRVCGGATKEARVYAPQAKVLVSHGPCRPFRCLACND